MSKCKNILIENIVLETFELPKQIVVNLIYQYSQFFWEYFSVLITIEIGDNIGEPLNIVLDNRGPFSQKVSKTIHCSRNIFSTNFKIKILWYNTIIQFKVILRKLQTAGGIDALTHVTQHFDAGFHVPLLTWEQPVAVIDSENSLQQLHKHWLPGLSHKQRWMSLLQMV